MPGSSLASQRIAIARAERLCRATGDPSPVVDARRDYAAAKIEDYLTRALATAPPLHPEQRAHLASLILARSSAA